MSQQAIPPFAKWAENGKTLLYNGDGELHYYIPENYFDGGKKSNFEGSFVKILGSFTYRIVSKTGTPGELRVFNYPTSFLCRPSSSTKLKDHQLTPTTKADSYRVLIFEKGDELVTNIHTPQDIDNTEDVLSLHIKTGKIPPTIDARDLYLYLYDSMNINGGDFPIHSQCMVLPYSEITRAPEDISLPFRLSKSFDKDPKSFISISIKEIPKYLSPYMAITSENIDEGIVASVLLTDDIEAGKKKHTHSPLEKVLTM